MFQPLPSLGLAHRVVMAPLTRVRGTQRFACGANAVQYYSERATPGGLIITEGVPVCPETQYEYAAALYTPEQEAEWKRVVDAVHAKGGKISAQLWHLGRMAHANMAENPYLKSLNRPLPSVSCSPTTPPGGSRADGTTRLPYTAARELSRQDIAEGLVQDFVRAGEAAKRCGFDFVEVHGAHGYLFDQFICDSTNLRTDDFGAQNVENRTRALLLVLRALIAVFGDPSRVALRLSPTTSDTFAYQGCQDSEPERTYREVVEFLNRQQLGLGYLLITEPRWNGGRGNADLHADQTYKLPLRNAWVKQVYQGVVIGSSSFTGETAEAAIQAGVYDAVAFGRFFLANPDLPDRLLNKFPLNVYDTRTFYVRDQVRGYIDYPTYPERNEFPQIATKDIGTKSEDTKQLKAKL